jgi:hypothetical protein
VSLGNEGLVFSAPRKRVFRRAAAILMTKDEARKIAAGIAKLPELLMRAKS